RQRSPHPRTVRDSGGARAVPAQRRSIPRPDREIPDTGVGPMRAEREPIEKWLSIKGSASASATLERLIGSPTVVVENGGDEATPKRLMYYRVKAPTGSREEIAKLELTREFAAKIVGDDPSDIPPEQLSPNIYRIVAQNLDAEIDLDVAARTLLKAA